MNWQIKNGNIIIEKYNKGDSIKNLSLFFNIKEHNIRHFLRKYNPTWRGRRRFSLINEDYFESINTQNKAYLLGFLCADGHVSEKYGTEGLHIELQAQDVEVLNFYNKELGTNKPIKNTIKNGAIYKKIRILSTKMRKDLNNLGIRHDKTQTLKFPKIPPKLISHFIRGYFDGDGCLYFNEIKPAHSSVSIIATPLMCNELKSLITKNLNINIAIRKGNKDQISTSVIYIEGGLQQEKFLDYIYKNSNLYLKRKYEKYKQFKQYRNKQLIT